MSESLWVLIAIGSIALLSGFVHSAIGFGFGIVAIALLPLVVDARDSHVVISTASIPVLAGAAWAYREGFDWTSLKQSLIGAGIFLPLGLVAFEAMSIDWLVRGTGLAVLVMVALSLRNRNVVASETTSSQRGACFIAGGVSGFLAGAVSIAGPPIAAFALKQDWPPTRFKAFVNQFLLVISVLKVVGLSVRGFITDQTLYQSALLVPLAIFGIWLGSRASRHIPTDWFQRLVATVLIAIAMMFLIRGAGG